MNANEQVSTQALLARRSGNQILITNKKCNFVELTKRLDIQVLLTKQRGNEILVTPHFTTEFTHQGTYPLTISKMSITDTTCCTTILLATKSLLQNDNEGFTR